MTVNKCTMKSIIKQTQIPKQCIYILQMHKAIKFTYTINQLNYNIFNR